MSSTSKIPDDLILSILCCLPPKSLLRFTAVCHSWNNDIKSPMFISNHLNQTLSITNNDHESQLFLLLRLGGKKGLCHSYMDKENDEALKECERFDVPFCKGFSSFVVIGCCNGVVCLFDRCSMYGYNILLWNPSIRKYLTLPLPLLPVQTSDRDFLDKMDFGFDSTTGDFKVLKFRTRVKLWKQNVMEAEVYSFMSGSWRIIGALIYGLWKDNNSETCWVNDSMHWIAYHREKHIPRTGFILVFDLRSEVFYVFSLPHCHGNVYSWSIHAHGESSIAAFDRSSSDQYLTDIWVMKEYGAENSWAKMWSFDPRMMEVSKTLSFRKNGELLVESTSGDITSLDLDVQQVRHLISSVSFFTETSVHKHVQSLILFDKGEDVHTYQATEGYTYWEDFWYTTIMHWSDSSSEAEW